MFMVYVRTPSFSSSNLRFRTQAKPCTLKQGLQPKPDGLRLYGSWFMVYGLWFMVYFRFKVFDLILHARHELEFQVAHGERHRFVRPDAFPQQRCGRGLVFGVRCSVFGVWCLVFGVYGVWFRVQGLVFKVEG